MTRIGNRQSWLALAVAAAVYLGTATLGLAADEQQFRSEVEVRFMEMENRFRTVTGQYEEAMYRLAQMSRTMENTLGDVEYRLRQLEQGGVNTTGSEPLAGAAQEGANVGPAAQAGAAADQASTQQEGGEPAIPAGAVALLVDVEEDVVVTPETHPEQYLEGDTPEEQFRAAFFLVRRGELDKAINAYRAFITLHPNHPYRANAVYWLGRSHAAQGNYAEAARILVDAYDKHADSDKGAEILLHLGISLEKLGQNEDACSAFGELDRRFPNADSAVKESKIDGQKKAGCS
jgi:tol-pal system protein YbgF